MLKDQKLDILSKNPLFHDLPADLMDRLAGLSLLKPLVDGETLFNKGDDAEGLYGVVSGKIKITTADVNGKEILLNIMPPGAVFGEIALLDGLNRTATASALVDSQVMLLRRADFLPLLDRYPALARRAITLLCERLRWTSILVEELAFEELGVRLARTLFKLAGQSPGQCLHRGPLRLPPKLSQQELADMVGARRESVSRQLTAWRKRGWLDRIDGRLVIMDSTAIGDIAAFMSED